MGILDALFGSRDETPQPLSPNETRRADETYGNRPASNRPQNADEQALAHYRYMLQTAPPEELEAAHQEAFSRLTPEQRQLALQQMSQIVPANEARDLSDDPRSLARAATRAEIRQPGAIERMFAGPNRGGGMMGGGMGSGMMGGMMAGSLLSSLAGSFIGSSIAHSFFSNPGTESDFQSSPAAQDVSGGITDYNSSDFEPTGLDSSADSYGDPGATNDTDFEPTGLDSSADPYGDPGDSGLETTDYDTGGFDSGGFDSGGFDGDM